MITDTRISSRPYAHVRDLLLMKDLLSAASAGDPHHVYWHVGNLLWSAHFATEADLRRNVRLWEGDNGALLGFAWFEEPDSLELQLHPRLRTSCRVEQQMLVWAAERAATSGQPDGPRNLRVAAVEHDSHSTECLVDQGFERDDSRSPMILLRQSLNQPIPEATLPEGWMVRHVAGEREFEERVEVHRDVWSGSRVTLQLYERLRSLPGYIPELDLVTVTPDGTFASYCICWLDPINKSGLFEPVGTRPAYQRRGLGKEVILEGLRRLRALGALTSLVGTAGDNEPATKLYESAGFRIASKEYHYVKQL